MTDENVVQVTIILQESSDKSGLEKNCLLFLVQYVHIVEYVRLLVCTCGLANTLGC